MTGQDAGTAALPTAGSYRIDPSRSRVGFTTRHMFGLAPVKGTFTLRSGEVVVADPVEGSSARATVDAASFDTGNPKRDKDVRSTKFLDTDAHPDITFASTGLSRSDGGWVLQGSITARGVSAPADLVVTDISPIGDDLVLTATTTVDRYAHGLTAAKGIAGRRLSFELIAHATRS